MLDAESLETFANVEEVALAIEKEQSRWDSATGVAANAENLHEARCVDGAMVFVLTHDEGDSDEGEKNGERGAGEGCSRRTERGLRTKWIGKMSESRPRCDAEERSDPENFESCAAAPQQTMEVE